MSTLLLSREQVSRLLSLDECIVAVERAFGAYGEGKSAPPGILGIPARDGGFHVKAALLNGGRPYFAVKSNGNFFQNVKRFAMPNIQGLILLCDGENGFPLAVMDAIEITILRTGAATAVAAKELARPDASVATICGCGNQGRIQLKALARVRPVRKAFAFDIDEERARVFAQELAKELDIEVTAVRDLASAVKRSDLCVTCTPSRSPFLGAEMIAPGTFIAAVGADSPDKQELDPALLSGCKIVVDVLDQCAAIGELHHALEEGAVRRSDVHAELGEIVAGKKVGRSSEDERIVFDSTGMGLQDVAAAAAAYEKAVRTETGTGFCFSA